MSSYVKEYFERHPERNAGQLIGAATLTASGIGAVVLGASDIINNTGSHISRIEIGDLSILFASTIGYTVASFFPPREYNQHPPQEQLPDITDY